MKDYGDKSNYHIDCSLVYRRYWSWGKLHVDKILVRDRAYFVRDFLIILI